MSRPQITLLLAFAWLVTPASAIAQDDVSLARRIADISAIALAEYAEGVVDGEIVSQEELGEARLFLSDARRSAEDLAAAARDAVVPSLDRMIAGVEALAPEAELRAELDVLRRALEQAVGAPLDLMPSAAPSLVRGGALYERECSQCHGDRGAGDGALAASMDPAPADLTDRDALRSVPLVEFFRKVNVGVAGTAMPGFVERLTVKERWAVALYAATLRSSPELAALGARAMEERCADCSV
ncbi:MAG: c-type cytochrome, partial [Gemmatimonadales bacterium]